MSSNGADQCLCGCVAVPASGYVMLSEVKHLNASARGKV